MYSSNVRIIYLINTRNTGILKKIKFFDIFFSPHGDNGFIALAQVCGNSAANALELPQSCTNPSP